MTDASPAWATEILVEVTRGAAVESIHRGVVVAVDPSGAVVASAGDPDLPVYVRSAAKPFQALALFDSGAVGRFALPSEHVAIAISSHSGEPFHLDLVRALLARTGGRQEWLRCGTHPPFDAEARAALLRQGDRPTALHHNCSGKHAGMIASSLALGADPESYLDPEHPVQVRILGILAALADMPVDEVGIAIDGCSAPSFRLPLRRFATAAARLAGDAPGPVPGLEEIRDAMIAHPEVIAGRHGRLDTDLMLLAREERVVLIAKSGAEGAYMVGVQTRQGPLGIAVKMEDGSDRGRSSAVVEAIAQLGALSEGAIDALRGWHRPALRNDSGREIGTVRPVMRMRSLSR